MPIYAKTATQRLCAKVDRLSERAKQAAIANLMYVGEACIREARLAGQYKDRTGNLRSSIGYAVTVNGIIQTQKIVQETNTGDKESGKGGSEASKYLQTKATGQRGLALTVVAGMNYAACVEHKGYNVLTSAELLADQLVPQLLRKLGFTTT